MGILINPRTTAKPLPKPPQPVLPSRVYIHHGVRACIPIDTRPIHQSQRISLHVAACRRVIVPHPVLVQAGLRLEPFVEADQETVRGTVSPPSGKRSAGLGPAEVCTPPKGRWLASGGNYLLPCQRPQCVQPFQNIDRIGQLVVLLAQVCGSFGAGAFLFDQLQLVLGQAVVLERATQPCLAAGRPASSSSATSSVGRGCWTMMSGEMPSA